MWALVAAAGVVAAIAFGTLVWTLSHRVSDTRRSRAEEEAAAARDCRPLANVTVLRGDDAGDRER